MTLFSSFDEIIAQINQKIKIQREKISGAIDIPDWEEAQNSFFANDKNPRE